jgi:nitrite reductase/ring-hydroxylating ferredoxin subunit
MNEVLVGKVGDFAVDDYRVVMVSDLEIGIFNRGDRIVAYENRCPHMGGPVCQGKMINRVEEILTPEKKSRGQRFAAERHIVCPWHGYEFNLDTGCHPGKPSVRLRSIDIQVREGNVYVSLPLRQ